MITIFTPTYNRAHTLGRLYDSLTRQTNQDFVWLIVDDGSTDETEAMVRFWQNEGKLGIVYYQEPNQGKSAAHNKGVELASTELFFCVDSDDYLVDDAVAAVLDAWEGGDKDCIGILAYKAYMDGTLVTKIKKNHLAKATLRAFYDNGMTGDTALIYKTSVLKMHRFPQFADEKFVTEKYLYDQLDQDGLLLLLDKAIYVCEYLPDGYTFNSGSLFFNNPNGYFAYLEQRLHYDKTFKEKFLDSMRYVALGIARRREGLVKNAVYPTVAALAYPAGWLLYCMRYRKLRNAMDREKDGTHEG